MLMLSFQRAKDGGACRHGDRRRRTLPPRLRFKRRDAAWRPTRRLKSDRGIVGDVVAAATPITPTDPNPRGQRSPSRPQSDLYCERVRHHTPESRQVWSGVPKSPKTLDEKQKIAGVISASGGLKRMLCSLWIPPHQEVIISPR